MKALPLTPHELDELEAARLAAPKVGYPGSLIDQLLATVRKLQAGPYAAPADRHHG